MAVARNMEATLGVPVFRVARRINTDRSVPRARAARAHRAPTSRTRRVCDAHVRRAHSTRAMRTQGAR